MDTPEEYLQKLERFTTLLIAELPKFTARQAMNATGLIVNRIQERGLNADEATLGIYTSEPYKKKRKAKGRQTEFVDLTFTRGGAGMFGSTGIVEEVNDVGISRVKVAGRDGFTQNKLDWNSDRYGDVLDLTTGEVQLITTNYEDFLDELITVTQL